VCLLIIIIILELEKYQKDEEELRHLLRRNLSPSLRSSSALISEIEGQLTEELVLIHAKMLL
jgi:hypothetical protein